MVAKFWFEIKKARLLPAGLEKHFKDLLED